MATYTTYAQYYIYFRSQSAYNAAILQYGAAFFNAAPRLMGTLLGISNYGNTFGDTGIVAAEYSLEEPGTEVKNPAGSGLFLSPSVRALTVPGQFGGDDMIIRWAGIIVKAPSNATPTDLTSRRRWTMGQEMAPTGEGGTGLNPNRALCRDASRFVDGLGWAFRNETGVTLTRQVAEYGVVTGTNKSWERLYIRLRTAPSATVNLWNTNAAISFTEGMYIGINTDRTIRIQSRNAGGAFTTQVAATSLALNLNQWYRFDILVQYGTGGIFRLYVGQTLIVDIGGPGSAGSTHLQSVLGDVGGGGTSGIEVDFDEWENSEFPDTTSFDSIDWLNGTRTKRLFVRSATTYGSWVPNTFFEAFNQMLSPLGSSSTSQYSSSTALSRLEGVTDAPTKDTIDDLTGFSLGVIGAVVGIYSSRVGGDGQLGYKIAGGADVLATISQSALTIFNNVAYRPAGALSLPEINPFSIIHTKGNTATASLVLGLQAVVSYIGIFGNEDGTFIAGYTRRPLIHNASGPNTLYANSGPYPNGNCCSFGTTYVGNGTQQDINLPFIPHMLWIRNTATTAGANGPVNFFGSSLGAHFGGNDRVAPDYGIRVWVDNGQAKITVCGADDEVNQNAVTYQLTCFCDPGMRYTCCGAWRHQTSLATAVNPLQNTLFTPEAVFMQSDLSNVNSNTIMSAYKGPGNSVDAGQRYDGTAQASFMTFAAGSITSRANSHIGSSQVNYAAFRTNDGTTTKMVQIMQYTGNGVNPRTIPLTPTSGKAPIFVMVQAVNGVLHFRDPSHTGVNCSRYDLAQITNAIIAVGVDSIQVQSALNTNLTVYNVFAVAGDATSMINGTFYAPSILPPSDAWFGGIAILNVDDTSGIYTLTTGLRHDTLYTRGDVVSTQNVKIPDPTFKTGYIGG